MTASLRIVMVGETIPASRTPQRLAALRALGHQVTMVSTSLPGQTYETPPSLLDRVLHRLRLPRDPAGANRAMVEAARKGCDVIWVEAARMVRPGPLAAAKAAAPGCQLVWYSEDDMMNPAHRSRWLERAFPLFDLLATTKSFNARPEELPAMGVRRVLVVANSFDPAVHRPVAPDPAFAAEVSFVGTFEAPRAADLLALARAGIPVRVWGNGWQSLAGAHPLLVIEGRPAYGDDYARIVASSRVNLCFLRKGNRDVQTCRSLEIPAMGGFMLHEASEEFEALFTYNRECGYFRGAEDLVAQCRRWLADDEGRRRVAQAGFDRAWTGGHTHGDRLREVLRAAQGGSET